MKIKNFILKKPKNRLFKAADSDVVITTRVRFARNISSLPFPWKATDKQLNNVLDRSFEAISWIKEFTKGFYFNLTNITQIERQALLERRCISFDHAVSNHPRAIAISEDEHLSVMINEEDHLRIFGLRTGLDISSLLSKVDALETRLGHELGFAFSEKYGYLTACPGNAGTALRVSCLLHLPALSMISKLSGTLAKLRRSGLSVRGFYGEGTKVFGDIYQISNSSSLGRSEIDIAGLVEKAVKTAISAEHHARKELTETRNRIYLEDKIHRSKAILSSSRKIDYRETLWLLSLMRLGACLDIGVRESVETIDEIMLFTQPAHLQVLYGKELSFDERDIARAKLLRSKLS